MNVPVKLTGMPCIWLETLPVPHATEWSLVVLVTVTVSVPRLPQVSVICSLPALLTPAARSATTATKGSARRRRISPPFEDLDDSRSRRLRGVSRREACLFTDRLQARQFSRHAIA